jgi:hypothetical protein
MLVLKSFYFEILPTHIIKHQLYLVTFVVVSGWHMPQNQPVGEIRQSLLLDVVHVGTHFVRLSMRSATQQNCWFCLARRGSQSVSDVVHVGP